MSRANAKPTPTPASKVSHLKDRGWRYTKADETDVRKTWARFGFLPQLNRRM